MSIFAISTVSDQMTLIKQIATSTKAIFNNQKTQIVHCPAFFNSNAWATR